MKHTVRVALVSIAFLGATNAVKAVDIDELPPQSVSWAPQELDVMDYFVMVPDTRRWWSFLNSGFGESYWQHAGVYSGSDQYGSKSIIHALAVGYTVQETPASVFLKYNTNRVAWFNQNWVDSSNRDYALETLRGNVVDRVYYPANVEIPFMDPDGIYLPAPSSDDKLYCSQVVHTVYDQLLGSSVTGYTTIRPITPQDLVDAADQDAAIHNYSSSEFDDILPGFGPIGSTRSGSVVDGNDEDWWNVQFEPGATYTIETLSGSGGSMDTVLYLYRVCSACSQRMFTEIAVNDDGGNGRLSKIQYQVPSNSPDIWEYKLMVRGYRNSTGSYKVTIKDSTQHELSYEDKCNYVFDEFERHFSSYFSNGSSTISTSSGYYRYYLVNGIYNYLYAYNDYLWYKIGGSWYKSSSIEDWYIHLSQ